MTNIKMLDPKLVNSFDGPAADYLKYSFLVVSILGLIGNSLSLLTVISKRCKRSSFTVYIGALAVVDSCLLISSLADTLLLKAYKVDLGYHGTAICKVIRFSQSTFRLISAWIIVAITTERALATLYPLQFKTIYGTKFGVQVVAVLAGLMSLLSAPTLYVMDYSLFDQGPCCVFKDGPYFTFINETFPVVLFVSSVFLPSFIIITGNTAIVIKVRRSRRRIAPTTSNAQSTKSTSRHLVVITLLLSSAFFVCTAPMFVAIAVSSFAFDDTNDTQRQIIYSIALTLQNMNFATNFYLYILSGRRFRELFISAVKCKQRRTTVQVTSRTGQTKSSSHCRKSIKMAAANRHMASVTLVDEMAHSPMRPMHPGSRTKGKTSSGFDTTRNIDQHMRCNQKQQSADDTTGVGI